MPASVSGDYIPRATALQASRIEHHTMLLTCLLARNAQKLQCLIEIYVRVTQSFF